MRQNPQNDDVQQHSSAPSPSFASRAQPVTVMDSHTATRLAKRYRTEIAASTSTVVGQFAAFPFDSVKTRMQTHIFPSVRACVVNAYKVEGLRAFWRGSLPPLVSHTFNKTISFSTYQKSKYGLSAAIERTTGSSPLVHVNTLGSYPTLSTVTCFGLAGAAAGIPSAVISNPFELIKQLSQTSHLMANNQTRGNAGVRNAYAGLGTVATIRKVIKLQGVGSLYTGFHNQLMRDMFGSAVYFATYESSKQLIATSRGLDSPTSPFAVVLAGGICGIAGLVASYPFETSCARYRRNFFREVVGTPVSVPAVSFFDRTAWRGITVSMMRSCLNAAMFFSCFELIKKKINNLKEPKKQS